MYEGISLIYDDKTRILYRNEAKQMKTRQDLSTKPYYKCLVCPEFRNNCAGLPTRDKTLQEWCELIGDVMDFFHLSCAYVAEKSDVSIKTVERIKAGKIDQDIMRGTQRRIEQVVLGCVGEHTCYLNRNESALIEQVNKLLEENEHLRKENNRYAKIIDKFFDT